jgi:hypothetical protein
MSYEPILEPAPDTTKPASTYQTRAMLEESVRTLKARVRELEAKVPTVATSATVASDVPRDGIDYLKLRALAEMLVRLCRQSNPEMNPLMASLIGQMGDVCDRK